MQEKNLYEYAVIRVVPRVEREEFLNVGVILFCKKAKYIKIANTAQTNASRDIADLLAKGCIKKVEGTTGRGTRYTINHVI